MFASGCLSNYINTWYDVKGASIIKQQTQLETMSAILMYLPKNCSSIVAEYSEIGSSLFRGYCVTENGLKAASDGLRNRLYFNFIVACCP